MVLTRNILNILATALALMAMSFLASCSATANEVDPDSPEGVVENFYKRLGSAECGEAMRFLLFERTREIEVFINNAASPADIQRLDTEIRGMPEVESVNYVSKEEALERLRESLKGHEDILKNMYGNPLPPSFEITVRNPADTEAAASRFFTNPAVDNAPGTHDGVKFNTATRNNDEMIDHKNFCDTVISDRGYELSEFNIISSGLSDTGEANVRLEVTAKMDRVSTKSGELSLTLVEVDGHWKIIVDESSPDMDSPGLIELMMIQRKESGEKVI